jgi:molecular chaperone GrpE
MDENDIKDTGEQINMEDMQVENTLASEENNEQTVKKKKNKKSEKAEHELVHLKKELSEWNEKYNVLNEKYLRLAAEFDNYKKRTLKEKSDLLRYGGESVLTNLLLIIDDIERANMSIKSSTDIGSVKDGINLIFTKFNEFLKQQGVKEIETKDMEFNTNFHEAVTRFPAPSEEQKGKVIDVVQKGYMLQDKVIRFAKVVVGE